MSTRNISWGKVAGARGWRPHHLHVPNVMEIWEPKSPRTLWATPGLLGSPLPLLFLILWFPVLYVVLPLT